MQCVFVNDSPTSKPYMRIKWGNRAKNRSINRLHSFRIKQSANLVNPQSGGINGGDMPFVIAPPFNNI